MPRGQPDYGIYTGTPVASGISDPGEAAARLGSMNVFDRRGWTVWMDDFSAPAIKWGVSSTPGGTDPVLVTTQAWKGIQSCYLATPALANSGSTLARYFPLLRLGKFGIEFWSLLSCNTPGYLRLHLEIYDGSNRSVAQLWLDNQLNNARIVTTVGTVPVATDCLGTFPNWPFTPVKLVVDMDSDKYVRLMIGPEEIDLSAYLLVPGIATTLKQIHCRLGLIGSVAGIQGAWVDNFILTQNEP